MYQPAAIEFLTTATASVRRKRTTAGDSLRLTHCQGRANLPLLCPLLLPKYFHRGHYRLGDGLREIGHVDENLPDEAGAWE
jgi:hypothetical protein